MVEISQAELNRFLSQSDFDFSTPAGWREFLNERALEGGKGRDADGIQLRDLKNYAVGSSQFISHDQPVPVTFTVRTQGDGLALPPGNLYVFHPNAAWDYVVSQFSLQSTDSVVRYRLMAGGGDKPGLYSNENWGTIYYIAIKAGDIPGKGVAKSAAEQMTKKYIKDASKLIMRGRKLLSMGGVTYIITVRIGNMNEESHMMDQLLLSPQGAARMRDMTDRVLEALE
ncbi:hypothetical protein [Consotaella aegiceratis]|uniref:hypothetical protein n=1 Tax=Consotaella aegiceratis TaxID=3097961 RepID=UPI002F41DBB0